MISTGLGRVVAFNWPKYVVAGFFVVVGLALTTSTHGMIFVASVLGLAALVYGIAASLVATWWVYDHRAAELYCAIASECQSDLPWILVHAGLDESRGRLDALIGPSAQQIDVGPSADRSRSLARAHRLVGRQGDRWNGSLPLEGASIGFAVVLFGIHELAPVDSALLLQELQRVVVAGGSIVIVEHLRDIPNALVFGPAALHFSSGRRWKTAIAQAGLVASRSKRVAAFVTVFCMRSPEPQILSPASHEVRVR